MTTDVQIRNYLDGRMESGLLLVGSQTKRMLGDAIKVASAILSTEASCLDDHPDFLRIKPLEGKSLGVNEIAPILAKAQLQPAISDRQAVLVEGFDRMTVQAQNRLLKLIEESELVVIGTALEDKMLSTIKSRMRVVTYNPLSFTEYEKFHEDKSFILPRYFATAGCPDTAPDEALFSIFCKVQECIEKGSAKELFTILSLVGEKDNGNFYKTHRSDISCLISLIGTLYAAKGNSDIVSLCRINKERCSQPSYTNNDFFMFAAKVAAGGKI